jgi:dienelactone hydrolase
MTARTACLPPLLAVLVSAPSLAAAQPVGPDRTDSASFEAGPCPFWSASESERFRVECGSLIVPEGGDSEPGELCPAFEGLEVRAAILLLPFEERTALVRRELALCRARLQQEGIDPRRFDSAALAHDLESLRSALGYQRLNLIGLCWGTRVVLETMRRFPESVRSAILYGPLPPDAPWHVAAATTGASLERLLRQCAADARTLPNAHLLVMRGKGHDVNVPTPCTAGIRARFLDNPLEPPDTACLGTLPPLSFATNVHVNAAVPRLVSRLALTRDPPSILGTALLFLPLLTGTVLLPVGWLSRRRSEERGAGLATGVIWAAAAVAVLFMLGLGAALWTSGDRYLALFGVPAFWGWLFVLPALALPLAAAGAVGFVTGWRRRWWSPRARMLRGVVAAASVAFVVIAVRVGFL